MLAKISFLGQVNNKYFVDDLFIFLSKIYKKMLHLILIWVIMGGALSWAYGGIGRRASFRY